MREDQQLTCPKCQRHVIEVKRVKPNLTKGGKSISDQRLCLDCRRNRVTTQRLSATELDLLEAKIKESA